MKECLLFALPEIASLNFQAPCNIFETLCSEKGNRKQMRIMLPFLFTVLLSGCINITNELQPTNADVQGVLMGEDCTPIVLGMGLGTNTIEAAKKDGRLVGDAGEFRAHIKLNDRTSISRIRTVQMTEFYILLLGSSCIQVLGEP